MRNWRVGTISMGIMLIMLGAYLLLSIFFGSDFILNYGLISWIPILLIILGVEILIYLFLSRKENPVIKYDVISLFLIGLIGLIGISFFVVYESGILPKVQAFVNQEVREYDLPTYKREISSDIEGIVIQASSSKMNVETQKTKEIVAFGTYATSHTESILKDPEDYLSVEKIGNTLYVMVKSSFEHFRPRQLTLIIPENLSVEIDANHESINLHPRNLRSNWFIKNASYVDIVVDRKANLLITTIEEDKNKENPSETFTSETDVNVVETETDTFLFGKGDYEINITKATKVNVLQK